MHPNELHLINLLAAINQGIPYTKLQEITHLHPIYYQKLLHIIEIGQRLYENKDRLSTDLIEEAKVYGFFNPLLAKIWIAL